MYEAMASYYVENGLFRVNHTRIARYEILWNFIRRLPGMTEEKAAEYREWLTLDLYLRDNVKTGRRFSGRVRQRRKRLPRSIKKKRRSTSI